MDDDAAPPPAPDALLHDLRARLRAWRQVEGTGVPGWNRGTEPGYLADLALAVAAVPPGPGARDG